MKKQTNKQFSTVRKLTSKVRDMESRFEEIELILMTMMDNIQSINKHIGLEVQPTQVDDMICNYSGLPSVSSYETEVDLNRDIPFDSDEVDIITNHLDENDLMRTL